MLFKTWRDDPGTALAEAVRGAVKEAHGDYEFPPPSSTGTLTETLLTWSRLEEWCGKPDIELLIILDQFDEYFLYHEKEHGSATFAAQFAHAVNHPLLR